MGFTTACYGTPSCTTTTTPTSLYTPASNDPYTMMINAELDSITFHTSSIAKPMITTQSWNYERTFPYQSYMGTLTLGSGQPSFVGTLSGFEQVLISQIIQVTTERKKRRRRGGSAQAKRCGRPSLSYPVRVVVGMGYARHSLVSPVVGNFSGPDTNVIIGVHGGILNSTGFTFTVVNMIVPMSRYCSITSLSNHSYFMVIILPSSDSHTLLVWTDKGSHTSMPSGGRLTVDSSGRLGLQQVGIGGSTQVNAGQFVTLSLNMMSTIIITMGQYMYISSPQSISLMQYQYPPGTINEPFIIPAREITFGDFDDLGIQRQIQSIQIDQTSINTNTNTGQEQGTHRFVGLPG